MRRIGDFARRQAFRRGLTGMLDREGTGPSKAWML